MKQKSGKNLLRLLFTLAMVIGMTLCISTTAPAETKTGVSYLYYSSPEYAAAGIAASATQDECIVVENSNSPETWNAGWYVVSGEDVTIAERITVSGEVHLILEDNAKLTAEKGITVEGSSCLSIYAQSTGSNMGKLKAVGTVDADNTVYGAGIGGYENGGGTVIINGGEITAIGSEGDDGGAAGIGGSYAQYFFSTYYMYMGTVGVNLTINGGNVTATGGTGAPGIGDGPLYAAYKDSVHPYSLVTVNGGTVTAVGNTVDGGGGAAGIGGGYGTHGVNVTITGGNVTATGGTGSAGIGDGVNYPGVFAATITISGQASAYIAICFFIDNAYANNDYTFAHGAGIGGGSVEGETTNRGRLIFSDDVSIFVGSSPNPTREVAFDGEIPGWPYFINSHMDQYVITRCPVAVAAVTLDPSEAQVIDVGGDAVFTAAVIPGTAADKTVKWTVGGTDKDAVKLYSDAECTGEVGSEATSTLTVYAKGISEGEALITVASCADETKSASCTVTVTENAEHSVTLTGGANAAVSGGDTTQTGLTGAMTTVIYTANNRYHFEEFADIVRSGITAARTDDTHVTVSGTPTANVKISVPDAVRIPFSPTASVKVWSGKAINGLTILLPDLPEGASYTGNCTVGGSVPQLISGTPVSDGRTLRFSTTSQPKGTQAEITLTFTSAVDSVVDHVVITVTADMDLPSADGKLLLPSDLNEIEESAFEGSSSFNEVVLPEGLQTIGSRAFAGCEGLSLVHVPDSVTSIHADAFQDTADLIFSCQSANGGAAFALDHDIPYYIE